MTDLASIGRAIWSARKDGNVVPRDSAATVVDRGDAYTVQAAAAATSGLTRAGWKIAATSDLAQDLLNVDGPALGPVFAEHIQQSPCSAVVQPNHGTAIECEIAFMMATTPHSASRHDVVACIDHAVVAIEIVGSRFDGGFQGAGTSICIADFAFNAGLVLGPRIVDGASIDFAGVAARAVVNGKVAAEGNGAAVMGDPITALCWAAEEAACLGLPLASGDVVSTGTMTGATPVSPGDLVIGEFGELGSVDIQF